MPLKDLQRPIFSMRSILWMLLVVKYQQGMGIQLVATNMDSNHRWMLWRIVESMAENGFKQELAMVHMPAIRMASA